MPLNRKQRLALGQRRRAAPTSTPVPITGWNTRDALASMPASDAVVLDNWYPDSGGASIRGGYVSYATGMGAGAIATLAEYNAGSIRKLIAGGGGALYDATSPGAVGAPLASGFLRDWWNTFQFNSRLFLFNGQDAPQIFDGTTMSAQAWTGPSSLNNLIGGTAYQQRVYLIEKNRTGFWYGMTINGISGVLSFFDLATISELGGNLVAIGSFSYDGGSGVFDYIFFAMNSGEIIIYSGNDPGTAANWQLVGRYRASTPINQRAVVRYGGECYMTTLEDHIAVQQGLGALRTGSLPPRTKACGAVKAAAIANPSADGWQAVYWTTGKRIVFNIPNPDGTFDQHLYNITNDAWCRYKGYPAATFCIFKDKLYFGGATGGAVYQAETGSLDNGAQAIVARGQQAWNTFGSDERKDIKAIRPVINALGGISYTFGMGFDYGDIAVPVVASSPPIGSPWDTSPWDTTPWSSESAVDPRWRVGGGSGLAISWLLTVSARQPATWMRTDVYIERGNNL